MSLLSACLRLLIAAAFAAGLGLPVQTATAMQTLPSHTMPSHTVMAPMPGTGHACPHDRAGQMPQDMACVQHCLGLSLFVPPAAPALPARATTPVWTSVVTDLAPSRALQPERHPPRV